MSILDALRVQQAENSSVRDLAMLPQAQIIKLAQMGQIPPAVVPIIISEKARMSQQAAQMQAAQSPTPPTVLEQAMAQNAQAEVPMNGVAAIPTQMFDAQNYASGGIVAFQGGGMADATRVIYGGDEEQDAPAVASPAVGSLDAYIREAAARRAEARKPSEAMLALERSLTEPGRFREARDEARNMALLQAGLGILGGTSPYALQNIGRGAAGAAEAYGAQMRDIRGQERDALRQRAALDLKKQEQALADIASGEAQYTAAQKAALEERKLASREEIERQRSESAERRAEARNEALARSMGGARATDRAGFVTDYVAGKRAEGDTRPEALLRLEGQQAFNNQQARFGLAETQLQATIINQVDNEILQRQREMTRSDKEALREWKKRNENNTEADYWKAQRDRRVTEKFAELAARTGASPAAQPAAAPKATAPQAQKQIDLSKISGIPPGSTLGKDVPGRGQEVINNGRVIGYIGER